MNPAAFRSGFALAVLGAILCATTAAADKRRLVFLLIGQSNMAGRGAIGPEDRQADPRIVMLTRDWRWVPARDPLHFDKPALAGAGLGLSFARAVAAARPGAEIALVPAAMGGSALEEWMPAGNLYENAVQRTRFAQQTGTLAGILWHQGESDAAPERARRYRDRFRMFAARLRQDLAAESVPLIVGEPGRFRPEHAEIRAVLATLPVTVERCAFVSSEGLADRGDKLHFATPALHELGRRYAAAWLGLAPGD